jgi:hypothetical protein
LIQQREKNREADVPTLLATAMDRAEPKGRRTVLAEVGEHPPALHLKFDLRHALGGEASLEAVGEAASVSPFLGPPRCR